MAMCLIFKHEDLGLTMGTHIKNKQQQQKMAMVACDLGIGKRKTGRALGSLAGLFRELHVRERHISKGELEGLESA